MNKLNPRYTKIIQTLDVGNGVIVMEDYYNYPEGHSNIYKVSYDLEIIWEAELPDPSDVFSSKMKLEEHISCGSWNGFSCEIDPSTGKIIKKLFTK